MGGVGIEKKRVLCYILLSKIRYSVYYFKISFMLQVSERNWKINIAEEQCKGKDGIHLLLFQYLSSHETVDDLEYITKNGYIGDAQ